MRLACILLLVPLSCAAWSQDRTADPSILIQSPAFPVKNIPETLIWNFYFPYSHFSASQKKEVRRAMAGNIEAPCGYVFIARCNRYQDTLFLLYPSLDGAVHVLTYHGNLFNATFCVSRRVPKKQTQALIFGMVKALHGAGR